LIESKFISKRIENLKTQLESNPKLLLEYSYCGETARLRDELLPKPAWSEDLGDRIIHNPAKEGLDVFQCGESELKSITALSVKENHLVRILFLTKLYKIRFGTEKNCIEELGKVGFGLK
tara:strand:+ start:267 stop:626 length:360 start_codon:yes stop_codon:yes gene_type:complete